MRKAIKAGRRAGHPTADALIEEMTLILALQDEMKKGSSLSNAKNARRCIPIRSGMQWTTKKGSIAMDDKKVIDVIDAEIARRCILIRFSNRHGKLWGKRLRRIRIASAHQTRPDRHADTPTPNTPLW